MVEGVEKLEGVVALGVGRRGVREEVAEPGAEGVESVEGAVGEVEGFEAEGEGVLLGGGDDAG